MEKDLELKLLSFLSTKIACLIGQEVNMLTIEHEISYDEAVQVTRKALELNCSVFRETCEET